MNENNTVQNTTLNVSLPEPLKEYVQERVSEGFYSNPSDYVRSLIREDMHQSGQRRLETLLLDGINSGDPVSIAEVVRDLHRNAGQPDQSYSERQIYEAALDRLARELAAVERIDKDVATQKLNSVLQKVA